MGAAFSTDRMAVCWKTKTGGVDRRVLAVAPHEDIGAGRARLSRGARPSREDLRKALPAKADPFFVASLAPAQASYDGAFNAPMLWNSNFFMTDEAMKILRLLIDVWLPDFKFGPGRCAITLARTHRREFLHRQPTRLHPGLRRHLLG